MDDADRYWLAGYLEGEGSFLRPVPSSPNRPIVQVQTTDEDVAARVAALFSIKYQRVSDARGSIRGWKPIFSVRLRGYPAVRVMNDLRQLMSLRRQQQIDRALKGIRPPRERLISVENAKKLAARYWAGEKSPTRLGQEFGIGKNLAIHYINKYAPLAQE
jgi:hypothetical protein